MKKKILMLLLSLVISASAISAPVVAAEQATEAGTESVTEAKDGEGENAKEQDPADGSAADTEGTAGEAAATDTEPGAENAPESEPDRQSASEPETGAEGPSDEGEKTDDGHEEADGKTASGGAEVIEDRQAQQEEAEEVITEDAQEADGNGEKAAAETAKTGLSGHGPQTVYYDNGKLAKNQWKTIDGKKYYFGQNGYAKTGWFNIGEKLFYAMPDGVVRSGFAVIGGKRYYLPADGNTRTGWQTINKKTYYLGENGLVTTGFKKIGGKTYYFMDSRCVGFKPADTGVRMTGFRTINGKKYYFFSRNCSGFTSGNRYSMATGWQTIDGTRYHFASSGVMDTGWKTIGGKKYYFTKSGKTRSGMRKVGSRYYLFSPEGYVKAVGGFLNFNGKTYYVDENGMFPSGVKRIDGKVYCLAANGEVRKNGLKQEGKYFYVADRNGVCKSGLFCYGKYLYMADEKTCRVDMNFLGDAAELKKLPTAHRKVAEDIIKTIYAKYKKMAPEKVLWQKNSYRIPMDVKLTRDQIDNILQKIGTTYSGLLRGYVIFDYYVNSNNVLVLKDSDVDSLSGAAEIYRTAAIHSFAKTGVNKCIKDGMSATQKVKAIDRYLCEKFTYRHEFDARRDESKHGIRYALESGYADTEYAVFFYAMCYEAGIECEYTSGEINKSSIAGLSTDEMLPYGNIWYKDTAPHIWNRVKLGGKWYYVDSAANDTGGGSSGKYLLSKNIWSDHVHEGGDAASVTYESSYYEWRPDHFETGR